MTLRGRIESAFEAFGWWVIRWRWPAILFCLALSLGLISGLQHFRIDNSDEAFLAKDDPERVRYEAFKRQYDTDDRIMVIVRPPEVFDFGFLERLRAFHDELEAKLPYLEKLTSLLNARNTYGRDDELVVEDLFESWPTTDAELEAIRKRVFANPLLVNNLISGNGEYVALLLKPFTYSMTGPQLDALEGFDDADGLTLGHPFDNKQGWGRMNIPAVIDPQATARYFDNPAVFDNTGDEWTVTLSPVDPAEPMRLMLVWTDAAGHGLGGATPAWNNDLDLVVEVGGDTYLGNVFDASGWSTPGGVADGRNNTEGVFLGPIAPATASIRVLGSNINSDGIPNFGTLTDQDFALVCYNCREEPSFTIVPDSRMQEVCVPDDPVFSIDIVQNLGFSESVTLSTTGEPAGTSTSFSVNPLTPPNSTVLTVSGTGAASEGSYSIAINGIAPSFGLTTNVTLDLFSSVPGTSLLTTPNDAAVDVLLTPNFGWTAASSAGVYQLQVATDVGMTGIVAQEDGLPDTSIQIENPLTSLTTYYWRVLASNVCGDGAYSDVFSFTTREIPAILLVDDDDNVPNVRSTYTSTLDTIEQDYDIWDTNNTDDEPTAADLAPYKIVIWFTGVEFGGTAGPGAPGESALATFLNAGNCLFISSQDYYFDRGLTGFMQNFLGVQAATSDVTQTSVTGDGILYGGMGPYALSYPFTNYSDIVSPNAGGTRAFLGDVGDAAYIITSGTADVVVESFQPGAMAGMGLGFDALEKLRPGIVLTSITPFGQTGPWRDYQATDLVEYAASGLSYVNGLEGREPLKSPGSESYYHAGLSAFVGSMTAICSRDLSGAGEHVDVSVLEAAASIFGPQLLGSLYSGSSPRRRSPNGPAGLYPCKDGYVSLNVRHEPTWQYMWLFFDD
ncbi:MAG: CoA transferase, partial [Acidobacteria bacterium]|nr:CoA transferase [Acidobacteriota bacterium]